MDQEIESKTEGIKAKISDERNVSIKVTLTAITAAYISLWDIFSSQ